MLIQYQAMQAQFSSMMNGCLVVFFWVVGLLSCPSNLIAREVVTSQERSADKIIVRLPGKVSTKDDDLLKVITDDQQISALVALAKSQMTSRTDWQTEKDRGALLPQPFLKLTFYSNNDYLFSFGMGKNFFSLLGGGEYRIRSLSPDEQKEFLKLIEITEEEYERLYENWWKPGPWKKTP